MTWSLIEYIKALENIALVYWFSLKDSKRADWAVEWGIYIFKEWFFEELIQ